MKLIPKISPRNITTSDQRHAQAYRDLLRMEARMGGELFGAIPAGHRREFFCLDERTWVWHEEWTDGRGKAHAVTTRYDVRPQGILKSQGSNSYQLVQGTELKNLFQAARLYRDNVAQQLQALHTQSS